MTVVRSAPDLSRFVPRPPDDSLRRGKRYLLAYLGVMGPQDGVDYALRALKLLRDKFGQMTSTASSWVRATATTT